MEVVFGECQIDVGDEPDKKKAIDRAQAMGKEPAPSPVIEAPPAEPANGGAGEADAAASSESPPTGGRRGKNDGGTKRGTLPPSAS